MFLFRLFRSFLPLENPIGFGAGDFLELGLTLWLVLFVVARPWGEVWFRRLAVKTGWCMLVLALLPAGLRLALLPHHPVPAPEIYDEFSHLLVADTLRHFRLANPPHPLHQFFETLFVLQQPTYSSIYPIGQGLLLAFGRMVFHLPWAGVLCAGAAFCSLCYWMLRGWVSPPWALLGGLLAVIEFGPLNQWMNTYWGGFLTAVAGCLVFGALPRLREHVRWRDAALLGVGLGMHILTRPYESVFLILSVLVYLSPLVYTRRSIRWLAKLALPAGVLAAAIAILLVQNHSVTGSWTTLPYQLSQYQYGVPSALTFQPNPVPHRELTPEQAMDYKMQISFHGPDTDTLGKYLLRLAYRVRFYRFYFLAPLYLVLPGFPWTAARQFRFAWVLLTVVLFALGTNFFPAFQFHYIAAVVCLFILMSVAGLQWLARFEAGRLAALVLIALCAGHFAFWYGLHLLEGSQVAIGMTQYETWDALNHRNPDARSLVRNQLGQTSGRQLVFVRYWPQHLFQEEWVYNEADIDAARIVWARDLGPQENEKLLHYYPDRAAWLLEPDARPPKLTPYQVELPAPVPPVPAPPAGQKPKPKPLQPKLRFENVH